MSRLPTRDLVVAGHSPMRNPLKELKPLSLGDIAGPISVAIVEIEVFTLPLWLGHAITSGSNPVNGYLHAWFFIYWGSLAVYVGARRIVGSAYDGEGWPTLNTGTDILILLLVYNGVTVVGLLLTVAVWKTIGSLPLALAFSIFCPMLILRCFELFAVDSGRLAEWGGV